MPLSRNPRSRIFLCLALVGQLAVIIIMLPFINSTLPVSKSIRSAAQLLDTPRVQRDGDEARHDYDDIYNSFGTHKSYTDWRLSDLDSFDNYTYLGNNNVGCRLTVSILDPRPPISGHNHPIWFALESVASYAPYACVVFHTASCRVIVMTQNMPNLPSKRQKSNAAAKFIYERSLPLFRRMMESGLVRINILDSEKYGLSSCDDFGMGNTIFTDIRFWLDEFIEGIDSNMVLTVQQDSVLCHHFDIDLWKQFAYVGAPWAPWVMGARNCDGMRDIWRDNASKCNGLEKHRPDESMSLICTQGHGGLVGNGGLSLRNRNWMVEAIRRCPTGFSGLGAQEDVFFSTVLNALNATMPTAFEAALFSVESIFAEQTFEYFFALETKDIMETIQRLWGSENGVSLYNRMHRVNSTSYTVPLGFHQPWNYGHAENCQGVSSNLCSNILTTVIGECKFLKYIYNISEMTGGRLN
jgi:hypothetical protein